MAFVQSQAGSLLLDDAATLKYLCPQLEDFFQSTKLLPFGPIEDRIVSITHPGEIVDSANLLYVLDRLQERDKYLLLKHVILNDILEIDKFTTFDWGYWTDVNGTERLLPYGYGIAYSASSAMVAPYAVCGLRPTISVIGNLYNSRTLKDVCSEVLQSITSYSKDLHLKLTSDVSRWCAFSSLLQKEERDLKSIVNS